MQILLCLVVGIVVVAGVVLFVKVVFVVVCAGLVDDVDAMGVVIV